MMVKDGCDILAWIWRYRNYCILFLSLIASHVQSDIEFTKDKHFSWKTGQWGRCLGEECGSGGVQTRTLWCVHSEGWTSHHSNCPHAEQPESQRPCFKVCEWHQDLFEWEVSDWATCVLIPFPHNQVKLRTGECITAQHGIQRRSVQCVRTSNRTSVMSRICEFFSHKPEMEQACLIPCPQDCVVSDFSYWSSCSKTCGTGLQHRTRDVLATPMYGGADCPNLTHTRPCSNPLPCPPGEQHQYSLKVGPWSDCWQPQDKVVWQSGRTMLDFSSSSKDNLVKQHTQSLHHVPHHPKSWDMELGYQTRQVRCTRSDGRSAMLSLCTQDHTPVNYQTCIMPKHCEISDWSSWSPCSKTCRCQDLLPGYRIRTRHMKQIPIGGGKQCPALEEKEACNIIGDLLPHCPRYVWKSTAWGDCRVAPLLSQQDRRLGNVSGLCGGGVQTREIYCVQVPEHQSRQKDDTDSFNLSDLPAQHLLDHPAQQLPNHPAQHLPDIPAQHLPDLPAQHLLDHPAQQLPNHPAQHLPDIPAQHLLDNPTQLIIDHPVQHLLKHGAQHLLEQATQHFQDKSHPAQHISDQTAPHHRKEVSRPVNGRLCAGSDIPSSVQRCSILCPQPCLLSSWSSWGTCLHDNCLEPQGRKGFRQRRRQVLWEPLGVPESCPHLLESIPCEDPICYMWRVETGGRCIPSSGTCGPGSVAQRRVCVNDQGVDVSNGQCPDPAPSPTVPCEVSCPGDCVISSWSSWSSCSTSCSSKNSEGRQRRSRTMLALPGEGGKDCPASSALKEWRECNNHPCVVFHWEATSWGPCIENSSMSLNRTFLENGTVTCAVGVQNRKVTCIKMNVGQVISKRCLDSARPDGVRPCLLPCRRDCKVTPFSEWTTCPGSCLPANSTIPTQSRYRTIIHRSANGGQECPDTLYEERDCEALPQCPSYRWQTHRWQLCSLVPDSIRQGKAGPTEPCGDGLEARGVSCIGEDEEQVDMDLCLQWGGAMPPRTRPCRIPCKDDCTFTTWSKFSECSGCGTFRSRKRSLTGRSKKRDHCLRAELYPLLETEACSCNDFLSQPFGNWSSCILPESITPGFPLGVRQSGHLDQRECGHGRRYRAVTCLDWQGRPVSPSLCSESGYVEEACHVPCPLDCKLSDWSPWSPCSTPCGGGLKIRSKWLREKSFNGGRPCPKLDLKNQAQVYEAIPCQSACRQFEWVVEAWSTCTINTVTEASACGEGLQSRTVRCARRSTSGQETNESLESCDPTESRRRRRHVLRLPSPEGTCPEDIQTEACVLNSTCFIYHYNVSDWSSCQLSEMAVCGPGTRSRLLDCVRSDGKVVELSVCEQFGQVNTWRLSEGCDVECPVNCVLSDWSTWSECSHTCGHQGQMLRSRSILQSAHKEGRPCPSQLLHTRSCPIRPCYSWLLGDWSLCHVEGADCGEGVRQRNLTCIVHWGDWPQQESSLTRPRPSLAANPTHTYSAQPSYFPGPVEDRHCGDKLRKMSEQELVLPCSVPCPGDCHMTEWSSWSSCQLTCLERRSFETIGRQTRSRAVVVQVLENQENCPQQGFETRPCKGGTCHTYEWRTSGWNGNERVVWCQRSDGVNVTGGCFLQNRPTTVRHCHPPCSKPFSHCTPSGVCGCEKGYIEVMTTHGFLDYCTRTPGIHNKKADVKTNSGLLKPGPSHIQDFFSDWSLQPIGPDGRVQLWAYGVTAAGFLLIVFIIALSFLLCKAPKPTSSPCPPQKPLTLAYDGDMDM
ncbi:thrombospondin type-1 domain-containing protein 7B isoform X3 [Esox lucius]|uniref:thrombospondin type-1 domain-containing protein 7B isoform X3 n=1 Tax=Esox lucius TaxID=8010 RepID=UPI001476F931|nr:thrombospondin type-1 domain-containing protein 7B isoform X3 [Esox lucius]